MFCLWPCTLCGHWQKLWTLFCIEFLGPKLPSQKMCRSIARWYTRIVGRWFIFAANEANRWNSQLLVGIIDPSSIKWVQALCERPSKDGHSVAANWILLHILWEHSPCYHWPGTTPARLKRSIDHASARCSNADAEVLSNPWQSSRQGLMDGSDRLQRSFGFRSRSSWQVNLQRQPSVTTASHWRY